MPYEIYRDKYYPPYICGAMYLMTGDVLNKLVDTVDNFNGKILVFEDLSITGIIASQCEVTRYHNSLFNLVWDGCSNVCPLHSAIAIFTCLDSKRMKNFWNNWIHSSPDQCMKKVQMKLASTKLKYVQGGKLKIDRQYANSKEHLKLTKLSTILTASDCNRDSKVAIFIHSSGDTSGLYYNRRQVIRRTWAKDLIHYNISMYFVLALNANQTVNEQLRDEWQTYRDIIQFPFIDNYHNLTLKAISVLRWITHHCNQHEYILKMDDDVIVNAKLLINNLNKMQPGFNGIVYKSHNELTPHRDPNGEIFLQLIEEYIIYPNKSCRI